MKKVVICLLVAGIAFAGCAKKEAVAPTEAEARKNLIEGTAFLKQGDVAGAIKSFVTAVKVAPDYFEGYYMLGETLLRLKQFPQATSVMSAAVRQFPNNGLAYYLLAMAQEGSGQPVPAIVAARRSVELFNAAGDKEGMQRAMILLATFVSAAKQEAEKQMAENAAKDAANAVASTVGDPSEPVKQ
jgi:tetratricopeptide (TPR) repeat protein